MEIVKKFARWVLRKELKLQDVAFQTQADLIHEYTLRFEKNEEEYNAMKQGLEITVQQNETMRRRIKELNDELFVKRKILVSQMMLECIVKMLPDPNRVGTGAITASDLNMRSMGFTEELGGRKFVHHLKFVQAIGKGSIQGLTINISDYNINVFIPLKRENISYEVYGVQTAIDTYFWDFYGAGIRMLSGEAWTMATEFIRAQNNVLKEFKQEGML